MEELEYQKTIEDLKEQLENITAERNNFLSDNERLSEENRELRQWNNKLFMKVSSPAVDNKNNNSTVLTPEEIKRRFKDG